MSEHFSVHSIQPDVSAGVTRDGGSTLTLFPFETIITKKKKKTIYKKTLALSLRKPTVRTCSAFSPLAMLRSPRLSPSRSTRSLRLIWVSRRAEEPASARGPHVGSVQSSSKRGKGAGASHQKCQLLRHLKQKLYVFFDTRTGWTILRHYYCLELLIHHVEMGLVCGEIPSFVSLSYCAKLRSRNRARTGGPSGRAPKHCVPRCPPRPFQQQVLW